MELENIYEVMELENKDEVRRKIEAMEELARSGSRGEVMEGEQVRVEQDGRWMRRSTAPPGGKRKAEDEAVHSNSVKIWSRSDSCKNFSFAETAVMEIINLRHLE